MNEALKDIPAKILDLAGGALAQANKHAVFWLPEGTHWPQMAVLNAALAGELYLKAAIATEHPLLIFKNLPSLESRDLGTPDVKLLLEKGQSYDLGELPKLLWVSTGDRIDDLSTFQKLRTVRNAIQHFCSPDEEDLDLSTLALEFIYRVVDPLIFRRFGICAIEFCEDYEGYHYLVDTLVSREIPFYVPADFTVTKPNFRTKACNTSSGYQASLRQRLSASGLAELLD